MSECESAAIDRPTLGGTQCAEKLAADRVLTGSGALTSPTTYLPPLIISNNDYPLSAANLNEPQYALPDAAYPPQLLAYPCSTRALRAARAADGLRRMYRAPLGVFARPGRYSVKLSFARMILSDVLHCTVPPLRVELSI